MSTNPSCTEDPVASFASLASVDPGTRASYGPGASFTVVPPRHAAMGRQQPLPPEYRTLSPDELDARIGAVRAALGRRAVILGHHYQRDEIVKWAKVVKDAGIEPQ